MFRCLTAMVASISLAAGASAQTASAPTAPDQPGGLGGALPDIGSIDVGNAAGLLGHCLKYSLFPAPTADTMIVLPDPPASEPPMDHYSVLRQLIGRQDVRSSPGYAAGQAGQVQTSSGRAPPLDDMSSPEKGQVCMLVLKRAQSFVKSP